jgi:hypothetical protein
MIRSNRYDSIKRLIVHTYGFEQLFTINNFGIYLSIYLYIYLSNWLYIYFLSLYVSISLCIYLSMYLEKSGLLKRKDLLSVDTSNTWLVLSIYLSIYLTIYLSIYLYNISI